MKVRLIVPWRSDHGLRSRLWRHCRAHWERGCPDWPIVEGACDEGPWNSAQAINRAAEGRWDVAVILDADTFCDPERVRRAVDIAHAGRMVLPYDRRQMLTPLGTRAVIDEGAEPSERLSTVDRNRDYASGVVVVPRALWDEVGGEDERFDGWGGHDDALWAACRALAGVERLPGPVWHLWHPWDPTRDAQSPLYRRTRLLAARYRATTDREAMRRLVAEPRTAGQVVLVCLTTGTRPTLGPTLASAAEYLRGPIGRRLLVVDGDAARAARVAAEHPDWDVVPAASNRPGFQRAGGYRRAVAAAIDHAIASGQPWVFWLEDDFTFNGRVEVGDLQAAMMAEPRCAQMSLGRQPVYPEEVAAGGFVEAWTKTGHRFTQRAGWIEHTAHWTMNPMLTTRAFLAEHPWPQVAGSERRFSDDLWAASPWPVAGIWGNLGDPPRVAHADGPRAGQGY